MRAWGQMSSPESYQRMKPPCGLQSPLGLITAYGYMTRGHHVTVWPTLPWTCSSPQENSTTRSASTPAHASSCSRKSDTCRSQHQGSVISQRSGDRDPRPEQTRPRQGKGERIMLGGCLV